MDGDMFRGCIPAVVIVVCLAFLAGTLFGNLMLPWIVHHVYFYIR